MKKTVSPCIFWGSNFKEHLFSEMYFLREQLFGSLWLLISVAVALCFHGCWLVWLLLYIFYQSFHHKQNIQSFNMYKYKSRSCSRLVAFKLGMWAEAYAQNDCHPMRNPPPPQAWVWVTPGAAWCPVGHVWGIKKLDA